MDFVKKSNFFLSVFFAKSYQKTQFFILQTEKNDFKQKKIEVLQKDQKWTFSKGVSPWILSENRTFCYRCFLQKLCHKRWFLEILNRKQSFVDYKIEVLTRAKKWTFFEGVSPWILSKNRTFSYLPFSQKSYQERSFLILSKEKNNFKQKKIEVLQRVKKWTFFQGVCPWRFVQKSNFFLSAFFREIRSENMVFDIVERKE